MIFTVSQVKTNFNMAWIAECDDKAVAGATCPFEKGKLTITIDYDKGVKDKLYYNPNETSNGTSLVDRLSFKLFSGEERIGTVLGRNQKVKGFLQSYPYRVLTIGEKDYYLYEVGFGRKGLYLCFYEEDKLIAIADKNLVVINYRDEYKIYAESDKHIEIIMPLLLHYDMTAHGDMMSISALSVKRKIVNTIQKELIAKYDPEFIPRIKAMHGIN